MMSYINETDFVIENKELVYPEIITDGLQLYYDAKGKRDTDYHRDTMLDMSGNNNHGKLQNFAYEKHSGYKDGLVFDYIDDKLVHPELNGIDANNFTYQLNSNILAFTRGEVKTVKNGSVEVGGRNLVLDSNNIIMDGSDGGTNSGLAIKKEDHVSITPAGNGNVYANGKVKTSFDRVQGETYTLSLEVNTLQSTGMYWYASNRRTFSGIIPNTNGEWAKISHTYTQAGETKSGNSGFLWGFSSLATGKEIKYRNLKLEKGNTATDWTPAPEDLLETTELKGNILGDMENIVDGLYKTGVLSGEEIYTDKSDDAVVHVEMDGKSYQHAGSGKNLLPNPEHWILENQSTLDENGVFSIPLDSSIQVTYRWSGKVQGQTYGFEVVEGNGRLVNTSYFDIEGNPVVNNSGAHTSNGNANTEMKPGDLITFTMPTLNSSVHTVRITIMNSPLYNSSLLKIKNIWASDEGKIEYEPPLPTPDYPIDIHSLNDFDVVSSVGKRNVISVKDIRIGGTLATSNGQNVLLENIYGYSTGILAKDVIQAGKTYTMSHKERLVSGEYSNGIAGSIRFYDPSGVSPTIANTRIAPVRKFSYESISDTLELYIYGSSRGIIDFTEIKVEESHEVSPYNPSEKDIAELSNHPLIDKINLLLDEPLRSVEDVKDRLFRDSDGLWKIERNIGEYVFGKELKPTQSVFRDDYAVFYTTSFNIKQGAMMTGSHFPRGGSWPTSPMNTLVSDGLSMLGFKVPVSLFPTKQDFDTWIEEQESKGTPLVAHYQLVTPAIEVLPQSLQDKLNNLRSFQDSNYVYTVLSDKDNTLTENLKPTLYAKFLYNNWYKEDRVVNNLMIYNRALTNEEMLQNYKTIKRRWGM